MPKSTVRPHLRLPLRPVWAFAALLWFSVPASALPEAYVSATVRAWGQPCPGVTCTFSQGGFFGAGLAPTRSAAVGLVDPWNSAYAVAAFRSPTPLLPFQPGFASLELGVSGSLARTLSVTQSGEPGNDLLNPLPRHVASASVIYHDQITFIDASQPIGAPISVTLHWALTSDRCPGASRCEPLPPPGYSIDESYARTNSGTLLSSRIELPGGPDEVSRTHIETRGGLGLAVVHGNLTIGNLLDHGFTVANGSTYDYSASAAADISFDAVDMIDRSFDPPRAARGVVRGWRELDYADTLRLFEIEAYDAFGNPLPGLALVNSLGWTLQTTPLPAVPEPGTWAMLLAGLALLTRGARKATLRA